MHAAAEDMKRVSLELGGQCPFVVLADADIEEAAAATRRSFSNMGQICITVNRVLVADSVHFKFLDAMAEATRKIKLGHGTELCMGRFSMNRCALGSRAISPTV